MKFVGCTETSSTGAPILVIKSPTLIDIHGANYWTMTNVAVGKICVFVSPFVIFHCPVTSPAKRNWTLVAVLLVYRHAAAVFALLFIFKPGLVLFEIVFDDLLIRGRPRFCSPALVPLLLSPFSWSIEVVVRGSYVI